MSRAEELTAKANRLRERQNVPAAEIVSSAVATEIRTSVATAIVRVRPVRLTVDVPPADHAALNRWCLDAAAELGLARVHGQEIVRALLHRALRNPELRAAITGEVAAGRASK